MPSNFGSEPNSSGLELSTISARKIRYYAEPNSQAKPAGQLPKENSGSPALNQTRQSFALEPGSSVNRYWRYYSAMAAGRIPCQRGCSIQFLGCLTALPMSNRCRFRSVVRLQKKWPIGPHRRQRHSYWTAKLRAGPNYFALHFPGRHRTVRRRRTGRHSFYCHQTRPSQTGPS